MANDTKTRGVQLIRTDESVPGKISFYDRRVANATQALIATIDVREIPEAGLHRFAVRGLSGNILDSSNKLDGDERVDWIRRACVAAQQGVMATTATDEGKLRETAIAALVKIGMTVEAATEIVNKR